MLQHCFEVKCYYVHFPDGKTERPRGLLRGNPIKILGGQPFQTSALQSSGPHRQRVRQWDSAIPRLRETKIPADAFSLQVCKLCKNLGGFFFIKGTTRFRDRLHESFLSLPVGCHFLEKEKASQSLKLKLPFRGCSISRQRPWSQNPAE